MAPSTRKDWPVPSSSGHFGLIALGALSPSGGSGTVLHDVASGCCIVSAAFEEEEEDGRGRFVGDNDGEEGAVQEKLEIIKESSYRRTLCLIGWGGGGKKHREEKWRRFVDAESERWADRFRAR